MKPLLNDRAAMTFHGAPPDAKFIVVDGGSGSVAESSARGYERNAISHELSTYLGVNSPYHWSSSLDSSDISSCNYTVSERDSDTMMLDCSLEDANRMSEKRIRRRKTVTDRFARSAGAEFCRRVQRRRESIDGAGPNRHNKTLFPARFRNLDCSGDPSEPNDEDDFDLDRPKASNLDNAGIEAAFKRAEREAQKNKGFKGLLRRMKKGPLGRFFASIKQKIF